MNRETINEAGALLQTTDDIFGAAGAGPPLDKVAAALLPSRQLLYTQVHDLLQKRIFDGSMPEGSFLPNEFDLSREFRVSIGTIRKAVDLLVEDNLVSRQQGRGTTVNDRRWSKNRDRINRFRTGAGEKVDHWQVREIEYDRRPCEADIAKRLDICAGEDVHYLHRLRTAANAWTICERLFIPASAFKVEEFDQSERRSTSTLVRKYGLLLGQIDERVSVEMANAHAAKVLDVVEGHSLLKLDRLLCDKNGKAVEFRITLCLPRNGAYWLSTD